MDNHIFISGELSDTIQHLQEALLDTGLQQITDHIARTAADVIRNNGKIIFAGNGISACHAQQSALMLGGKIAARRAALPAVSIASDAAFITAAGMHGGFDSIFSRQIEAIGKPGDMLIIYSITGDEENIKQALHTAKRKNMICVGFCGQMARTLTPLCDALVHAPASAPQRVTELHGIFSVVFASLVEVHYFNEGRFADNVRDEDIPAGQQENIVSFQTEKELKEGW